MVDKCLPSVKSVWPNTKRTALHVVARHGHSKCISILVESGANTETLDKDGKTPLALAAWQNDCESIQELLKAGARAEKVGTKHLKNIKQQFKINKTSFQIHKTPPANPKMQLFEKCFKSCFDTGTGM